MSVNRFECFCEKHPGEGSNVVNVTTIFVLVKYSCLHSHTVQLEVSILLSTYCSC